MLGRTVLGLDIGSYAVKAVELKAGLRAIEVLRAEQTVLPHQASPEELEATIHLFLQQLDLAGEFVITALSADRVTQRHLRFPFTGSKRVSQAVGFEIEEGLPLSLDSVILACENVPASPEQTDVLAILAPRSEVELHLASLRRMEVEPHTVEVEGSVLANLSHYLDLAAVGRLVLDVGHRKSTLCLLVDGKPALVRTIGVAGMHFTEALAKDQKMSYDAAEELKHERGLFEPGSTKSISPTVGTHLDHLARETMRSLQSVVGDPLDPIAPSELVLTGGSSRSPGFVEYLKERTGLTCVTLALPDDALGAGALREVHLGEFAHATALALRGAPTERITQMDLRQAEFAYVPDLSGLRGQLQVTLALFGLVLFLWVASLTSQIWGAGARVDALQAELARVHELTFPGEAVPADPVAALENRLRQSQELAAHLGVTGSGLSALDVLRLISERVPEDLDISLSELQLERRNLRARGYSRDCNSVDRMRAALARVAAFERVELSDCVNEPRRGGKSFSLRVDFSGNEQ